jgi:UDP-glucose:(heptosyl)LPS alpha-1,3-glucosyltransferase
MKIALIRKECSFRMGGAERYAGNLARSLSELGHTVWILAERCDDDIHPALIHVPIKVSHRSSAAKNRTFHRNSQKAVASLDADVVIALSRSFPADAFRVSDPIHKYWMRIRYPGKLQRIIQRLNPRHKTILSLEKGIFDPSNTRFIITNSELSKRLIPRFYPFPQERIHVIYNGVDLDKFVPSKERIAPRDDEPVKLLFVGQDFKRKGLIHLINALVEVKMAGHSFHLRVIGREKSCNYQSLATKLGLAEHITFEGPSGSIQEAYKVADLFVFPSLYDPFANVCLEALACGLPVLTTTTNGSSEIITQESDGYVVDGSETGLAERLTKSINQFSNKSSADRETMRSRARKKAENYTIKANTEKIIELLKSDISHGANSFSLTVKEK